MSEQLPLKETVSGAEEFVSVSVSDVTDPKQGLEGAAPPAGDSVSSGNSTEGGNHLLKLPASASPVSSESDWETLDPGVLDEGGPRESPEKEEELLDAFDSQPGVPITVQPHAVSGQGGVTQGLVSGLEEDQYGLPLAIFTKVSFPTHSSSVALRWVWLTSRAATSAVSLPGLPVPALHGAAAASPPVRRGCARLRRRGNQHPVSSAKAPQ